MPRQIHVIGPYNTGTNLLFNIINNSECMDLTEHKVITTPHQDKPINKHTLEIKDIEEYLNDPNNILIIIIIIAYNNQPIIT
jgi:5-methylthioribose kinase